MRYTEISDGLAVAEWESTDAHTIPTGTIHGGHIAAVADSVCSLAAITTLDKTGMTAGTLTLSLEFYRYTYPGMLTYKARVSHRGRRTIFVSCEVTDAEGRGVANARASLSVNQPRPS
jgi:uncharacterized protein (TIGR00369 family)